MKDENSKITEITEAETNNINIHYIAVKWANLSKAAPDTNVLVN